MNIQIFFMDKQNFYDLWLFLYLNILLNTAVHVFVWFCYI